MFDINSDQPTLVGLFRFDAHRLAASSAGDLLGINTHIHGSLVSRDQPMLTCDTSVEVVHISVSRVGSLLGLALVRICRGGEAQAHVEKVKHVEEVLWLVVILEDVGSRRRVGQGGQQQELRAHGGVKQFGACLNWGLLGTYAFDSNDNERKEGRLVERAALRSSGKREKQKNVQAERKDAGEEESRK